MVQAISGATPTTALQRLPQQVAAELRPAAAPAPATDSFQPSGPTSAKPRVAGIWSAQIIGDSQRSYLLTVPKALPASFHFDLTKLDAADRKTYDEHPDVRPLFAKLQYLETVDPQGRQALADLRQNVRNGDIMLRTYGTPKDASGVSRLAGMHDPSGPGNLASLAIFSTGGDFSHAAIVARKPGQAPQVVQATYETGVSQDGFYTFVTAALAPSSPRGAITVVRPTQNSADADAAVRFAQATVGTKYNFAMRPNHNLVEGQRNGWFCSQLVFEAYDMNHAISQPVIGLKPDAHTEGRSEFTNAVVRGLHAENALAAMFQEKHAHEFGGTKLGLAKDLGAAWLQAGPKGMVYEGIRSTATFGRLAAHAAFGLGPSPSLTYEGRPVPAYVAPGDLGHNDGHKVVTVLFDNK